MKVPTLFHMALYRILLDTPLVSTQADRVFAKIIRDAQLAKSAKRLRTCVFLVLADYPETRKGSRGLSEKIMKLWDKTTRDEAALHPKRKKRERGKVTVVSLW